MSLFTSLQRLRDTFHSTPPKERWMCGFAVVLLYSSSCMQFFGMNFWLWSFSKGSNTFVSMILPAVVWALLINVIVAAYWGYRSRATVLNNDHTHEAGASSDRNFNNNNNVSNVPVNFRDNVPLLSASSQGWLGLPKVFFTARCVAFLVLMGFLDSLGGLTCVYATTHIPLLVQSLLVAGGPIYTFCFSCIFYPKSVHAVSPLLGVSVVLLLGGITASLEPQFAGSSHSWSMNPLWLLVYLCSAFLPPLLNVAQGRFLGDYRHLFNSPLECKIASLWGDMTAQVFITWLYLPLDAVPQFGNTNSLAESLTGFEEGCRCVFFECSGNAKYFFLYTAGLFLYRISMTFLNNYSPTLGAVVGQLIQPINTFLLLVIPSWNIFGQKSSVGMTALCFVLMTCSMATFILWHLKKPSIGFEAKPAVGSMSSLPAVVAYSSATPSDIHPGHEENISVQA